MDLDFVFENLPGVTEMGKIQSEFYTQISDGKREIKLKYFKKI
jgi:hypothetical protein